MPAAFTSFAYLAISLFRKAPNSSGVPPIGIAPRARVLNLRVLNSRGIGSVSSVLSALDWLMQMAPAYNVRVVNMSLGMPAINSYRFDPLCVAVRKLVDKGIVVVAAAGNNGKNSAGQKIYGQIHAPGNEPAALRRSEARRTRSEARVAVSSASNPSPRFTPTGTQTTRRREEVAIAGSLGQEMSDSTAMRLFARRTSGIPCG